MSIDDEPRDPRVSFKDVALIMILLNDPLNAICEGSCENIDHMAIYNVPVFFNKIKYICKIAISNDTVRFSYKNNNDNKQ